MAKIDLTGQKFGRLTVSEEHFNHGRTKRRWFCVCECGRTTSVFQFSLKRGITKSCGCLRDEMRPAIAAKTFTTHGMSKTPEFVAWCSIVQRCTNPRARVYKHYGGRGIKICDKWASSFDAFFNDVGPRPSSEHSIDRINVDGDYEPNNVRWATRNQQAQNQRRRADNTSGVVGVSFCRPRKIWSVSMKRDGEMIFHKEFKSKEQAVAARLAALERYNQRFRDNSARTAP